MRAFGSGCLLVWMASILLGAQAQLPQDHPPVGAPDGRSAASDLTERLRPSSATPASKPVPRKNLIDEFIFGKMEKDGVALFQPTARAYMHSDSRAANLALRALGPAAPRLAEDAAGQLLDFFGGIANYVQKHPKEADTLLGPGK